MSKTISLLFAKENNLVHYFTGKPCRRGHVCERNTKNKTCLECAKISNSKRVRPENYSEKRKEYNAKYLSNESALANRKAKSKEYRETPSARAAEMNRLVEYYARPEVIARRKSWYADRLNAGIKQTFDKENRKKYINKWMAEHRATPYGKAIAFMRKSVTRVLNFKNFQKSSDVLGYSKLELISHLEKQFLIGMSWSNYGEWHIDHITPISFMLKDIGDDAKTINALSNLRPMWAADNLRKGAKQETLL